MSANLYLPLSDQSLNDLGDDVAMGKASFEREKDRYRRQRNDQCTGSRRGRIAFVPRGVSKGADQTVVRRVTPDPKLLLLASAWRVRAKEILLRAETMKDADARRETREVAASYERLAQQVEQLSGEVDNA